MKKTTFAILLLAVLLPLQAADPLVSGLDAYAKSDWPGAILAFRKAAAANPGSPEPAYWLIMAEISAGEPDTALTGMKSFLKSYPSSERISDVSYQLGRVLYTQRKYEEAVSALYDFLTRWPSHESVPSAYYWIGECLYSVGRFAEARSVFLTVLERFPDTVKREAAWYRVSLIDQGAREDELLKLLKTSHEESLRIIEDYQRREKTYEQAITAYQKRISDLMKDTRLGELEKQVLSLQTANADLTDSVARLTKKNSELEELLSLSGSAASSAGTGLTASDLDDAAKRQQILEELRKKADALQGKYNETLQESAR